MTVEKDPECRCCGAWAKAYRMSGCEVVTCVETDMDAFKATLKVPEGVRGCHIAVIDGYYLEGYVPLEAPKRHMRSGRHRGSRCRRMPVGSLGMGADPAASSDMVAVPRDSSKAYVDIPIRPS